MKRKQDRGWLIAIFGIVAGFLLGLWVGSQFLPSLSQNSLSSLNDKQQDEYVTLVAVSYTQSSDLPEAEAQLVALQAPNNGFLVAGVAERQINNGASPQELSALAQLAMDLGVQNSILAAYLPTPTLAVQPTPTAAPPTPTSIPPTSTPIPVEPTPTSEEPTQEASTSTPEAQDPTPTSEPDTPTPLPAPAIIANDTVNVRGGPGTSYPTVGSLAGGERAPILGRDSDNAWWQIDLGDSTEGWVYAQIVNTEGDVSGIAVAANIPTPPVPPTPAEPPTPTPAPKPAEPYVIASTRLQSVGEHAQRCGGGNHHIRVTVLDAAGNPLNGVRVMEVFTKRVFATGDQGKGDGRVEFDIYKDGGGQVQIVDENNNPVSALSIGMPSNLPPFDLLQAAGYCGCKPYPDTESCHAGWEARDFRYFPMGHYVYEIVFHRTY